MQFQIYLLILKLNLQLFTEIWEKVFFFQHMIWKCCSLICCHHREQFFLRTVIYLVENLKKKTEFAAFCINMKMMHTLHLEHFFTAIFNKII